MYLPLIATICKKSVQISRIRVIRVLIVAGYEYWIVLVDGIW